jgi:ubiquinone/menaquinone biosynthesis C-methylase UbiE
LSVHRCKEENMAEDRAQYDRIGSKYDEYARTATLKQAECYTFFCMVGALEGQRVMDLACGFGFYTRLLKAHGAAHVIGVDISPEMLRLARQQEQAEPLGITYHLGDAITLPHLGPFDLITAFHLLHYATSQDQMRGMFRSAYNNLVMGGRFIAYGINPAFTLSKPNCTKYGFTVLRQTPQEDRYVCDGEFVTDPPTPLQYFQWNQATYEWASKDTGFRTFAWYPSEVSPEDLARYGESYWHDYYDNCLVIGLVCQK